MKATSDAIASPTRTAHCAAVAGAPTRGEPPPPRMHPTRHRSRADWPRDTAQEAEDGGSIVSFSWRPPRRNILPSLDGGDPSDSRLGGTHRPKVASNILVRFFGTVAIPTSARLGRVDQRSFHPCVGVAGACFSERTMRSYGVLAQRARRLVHKNMEGQQVCLRGCWPLRGSGERATGAPRKRRRASTAEEGEGMN